VSLLRIISRSIWQSLWKHLPASSKYTLYERAYVRADISIRIRISAVRCAHARERTHALCRANVAERASTESRKASKGKEKGQTTPYAALAVERIRLRLRFSVSPLASGITNISTASSPPRPLARGARSFAIRDSRDLSPVSVNYRGDSQMRFARFHSRAHQVPMIRLVLRSTASEMILWNVQILHVYVLAAIFFFIVCLYWNCYI